MKFSISRDVLLKPLQIVNGAVERRPTVPVLGNVLISLLDDVLSMTATDMEIEVVTRTRVAGGVDGEITVPAQKFLEICRSLPEEANVEFVLEESRVVIRSGRSRFNVSTLPAADFPGTETPADVRRVTVSQGELKRIIQLTQFAMAKQDVRYYLNGLLLEFAGASLRAVATDGHRLAMAQTRLSERLDEETRQLIVPRKGILELARILDSGEDTVEMAVSGNAFGVSFQDVEFTSKLIDGRFPDYERVIPDREQCDKVIVADREAVRRGLARASILSNEKYRAVRLSVAPGALRLVANNPEQEEAEDEVEVEYAGDPLEIGFNVSYLMDAFGVVPSEAVRILLSDASSSCLILPEEGEDCRYVVMPMRL